MAARLLVGHHRGPDLAGVEIVARGVDQAVGLGFEDARREALADQAALTVAAVRVEAVADHRLAVADDVGDDGNQAQRHLREVDDRRCAMGEAIGAVRSRMSTIDDAHLQLGRGSGGLLASKVDLVCQQCLQYRPAAPERDLSELLVHGRHEKQSAELRGGAQARMGKCHILPARFDVLDQIRERFRLVSRPGDDRHTGIRDDADGPEIGRRIKRQFAIEGDGGRQSEMVEQDGVPVGIGANGSMTAGRAASTGHILDNDILAEDAAHRFRGHPSDRVGRPSGGKRNDHRDRPCRIILCHSRRRDRHRQQNAKSQFRHRCLPVFR
jgi:hypothetical protein